MEAIKAMGVSDFVRFDANIVRGLLYYTGTVFEAYDLSGDIRRSILGGGRYNNLLSDVGGESLPAVGFAMGDVIITLLLQKLNLIPQSLVNPTARVMVTVFDEMNTINSLALAAELRQSGINTICYPEAVKLSKQMKFADRMGISIALMVGPDEIRENSIALKNLATGSQQLVPRSQAAKFVLEQLN
jgi:histidyl-tRNA synthetase